MSLDNIQAVEIEEVVKRDERLSTNSIRFKPESLDRAKERVKSLEVSKDHAMRLSEHITANAVEQGATDEEIKEKVLDSAILIARLENEINILKTGEIASAELVDSKAIRLVDKMIKAARTNSKTIYAEVDKEDKVESEAFSESEITADSIDVEKIAKENEEPVKESVENAIENESLKDEDVQSIYEEELSIPKIEVPAIEEPVVEEEQELNEEDVQSIFDEALSVAEPEEPKVAKVTIDADELEQKINENVNKKLEEFQAAEEKAEEKESLPVPKPFDFKNMFTGTKGIVINPVVEEENDAVREMPEIAPEREEVAVEKEEEIEEYTTAEEVEEPKKVVFSLETKEKLKGCTLEELTKILENEDETTTELEQEVSNVEADIRGIKEVNAQVIAEEAAAAQKLADLDAEAIKTEKELKDMMIERAYAKQSKNNDRRSYIQSKIDEMDDINKDTGSRLENLERLDKESASKKEQLEMFKEMMMKYSGGEQDTSEKQRKF